MRLYQNYDIKTEVNSKMKILISPILKNKTLRSKENFSRPYKNNISIFEKREIKNRNFELFAISALYLKKDLLKRYRLKQSIETTWCIDLGKSQ